MTLRTLVKISAVTNLSDARYCAGMGVEMMGFNIDPNSPKFISSEKFKEISSWVAGVKFVGEYHSKEYFDIHAAIEDYGLDLVEANIHYPGFHDLTDHIPVIAHFDEGEFIDRDGLKRFLDDYQTKVDCFIFDGSEQKTPTEILQLSSIYKIILGSGVGEKNVLDLVKKHHIYGIALKGGEEITPGYKDFDELADILEKLELED